MSAKRQLSTGDEQGSSKRQKLSTEHVHNPSKEPESSIHKAFSADEYYVGWICALPSELAAAKGMLDQIHKDLDEHDAGDKNVYILGRIHAHNVVIACCPAGIHGLTSAATVAKDLMRSFPSIRVGLMVGIGGGAPSAEHDVRLGDVVVSQPYENFGGVVQFDRGRTRKDGEFQRTGALNSPPTALLTALSRLKAEHEGSFSKVPFYMSEMLEKFPKMKSEYVFQGAAEDFLYEADYEHPGPYASCGICDPEQLITREAREDDTPHFHYGNIASSSQVMQHGGTREKLRAMLDVLCFEMEAAGLMLDFPCIVIRGICDYSDSHKGRLWQKYAAATAAAFAKEFLYFVSAARVRQEKPIQVSDHKLQEIASRIDVGVRQHTEKQESRFESAKYRECHQAFKTSTYEAFKKINPDRVPGTCIWVLEHPKYTQWLNSQKDDLLWISADPGCGKSVLAQSLVEQELRSTDSRSVCYFFFKDNESQDGLAIALCALLHQLFDTQPQLLKHAMAAWNSNGDKLRHEVYKLWNILVSATSDHESRDVICVLDALDESRGDDCQKLLKLLSDFYKESAVRTSQASTLKFLVTSRPYDFVQSGFQDIPSTLPTIRLSGEKENDKIHEEIDLVIRERVALLAETNQLSQSKTKELEQWLLKMEYRTYLWLHLAINSIEQSYKTAWRPDLLSIESLQLPSSIDDAYEKILRRIENEKKPQATTIFHIIIGARRPLTTGEMALALGLAPQPNARCYAEAAIDKSRIEELLPDLCGLFVFINYSRIYLIHQTAKEFLIYQEGMAINSCWKQCLMPDDSEATMARICVAYLLLEELDTIKIPTTDPGYWAYSWEREHNTPKILVFVEYSAIYWASHVRNSTLTKTAFVQQVLKLYQVKQHRFRLWFPIYWSTIQKGWEDHSRIMNDIRLAAFNGHSDVLKILLDEKDIDINAEDHRGRTALSWAIERKLKEIVEILLENGAKVIGSKHQRSHNALEEVMKMTSEAVVRVIFENLDTEVRRSIFTSAIEGGSEQLVRVMVEKEFEENTLNDALVLASTHGSEATVRALLEKGVDPDGGGRSQGFPSALYLAASRGQEEIAEILLLLLLLY